MAKRNDTRAIVESFVGELETLMREHVNRQLAAAWRERQRQG